MWVLRYTVPVVPPVLRRVSATPRILRVTRDDSMPRACRSHDVAATLTS